MKNRYFWAVFLAIWLTLAGSTAAADIRLGSMADDIKDLVHMVTSGSSENLWQTDDAADRLSVGPKVIGNDPSFKLMRSSAYLQEDKYSKEAHVFVELKNVSGRTLYPGNVSIKACGAYGNTIKKETYADCRPSVVADGESLYIWEWFYDVDVSHISFFEVDIETETRSYEHREKLPAEGEVSKDAAYMRIKNNTAEEVFGIEAFMVMSDEQGVILDITDEYIPRSMGILPGETMVIRGRAEDYKNGGQLRQAQTSVFAQYTVD